MATNSGPGPTEFSISAASRRERLDHLVEKVEALHRQQPDAAMLLVDQALELALELGDHQAQFEILLCAGRVHVRQGQFSEAETKLQLAVSLTSEDDRERRVRAYLVLGAKHALQEQNDLALDYYFKGLACDVDTYRVQLQINVANLYFANGNYEKSLRNQKKALIQAEANGDSDHTVYCLSNIGAIQVRLGNNDEALSCFKRAIEVMNAHQQNNPYMRCSCELNLGEVYRSIGDLGEAEEHYEKALRIAKMHKLVRELAQGHQYLGELKRSQGKTSSFIKHHAASRKLCEEHGFEILLIDVLDNLRTHFEDEGNFSEAYSHLKEITRLRTEHDRQNREKNQTQLLKANEKKISILEEQKKEIERQKQKLEKSNRELEQNNRELEQYAFIVAHDLKEPLRNISSFTSLIQSRYVAELDESAHEYMGYVVRNVQKMHLLLTELLRYNTLKRKTEATQFLDLNAVAQEVTEQLREMIEQKQAMIMIEDLPSLRIHHFHAVQIFQNLIKNALQFNASDRCEIRIGWSWDGTHHRFWVQDNGIGIDQAYQDKIFNLFNRLDRETFEGTGIGLAMCRKITQLYDGDIWVQSEPGRGSTFYFSIRAEEQSREQSRLAS